MGQMVYKPGSVCRQSGRMTIHLGRKLPSRLMRPTRT